MKKTTLLLVLFACVFALKIDKATATNYSLESWCAAAAQIWNTYYATCTVSTDAQLNSGESLGIGFHENMIIDFAATFTNYGNINNRGDYINTWGTLDNHGIFNSYGFMSNGTNGLVNNYSAGTFENRGTLRNYGRHENWGTLDNYGAFNNQDGGHFNNKIAGITKNYDVIHNYGAIDNRGTIRNWEGGQLVNYINSQIDNYDTGHILSYYKSDIDNYGNISSRGAIDNYCGSTINNGGTITNWDGGKLSNYSTINNLYGGQLSNYGTIDNLCGACCGQLSNYGHIDNDGTVNNHSVISNRRTIYNHGTIWNDGIVYNMGLIAFNPINSFAQGGVLELHNHVRIPLITANG